ncbi:hypothetical protein DL96DRAFT_1817300 [Flagelloscypha sp. PMI_526]|nr:hypothetical protein DL96DRAFT_1817300 [Flagelloscypha sp. PMI_526]
MIPELAPELISNILVFCDKATLQKCCTLSKDFYLLSASILFNTLTIDRSLLASIHQAKCRRFPQIVTVNLKHIGTDGISLLLTSFTIWVNLRLIKIVALRPTEDDLTNINHLCSSPSPSWHICANIGALYGESSPSAAPGIGFKKLKDLRVGKEWGGCVSAGHPTERPTLHTLRIEHDPSPWSSLEAMVDISQLQRLSFWLDGTYGIRDHHLLLRVLELCAHSLSVLSIFKCSGDQFSQDFLQRPFPELESLMLWIAHDPFPIRSWMKATLTTLVPLSPCLRRLCLFIHLPPSQGKTVIGNLQHNEEFEDLVTFLAAQKAILHIDIWFWSSRGSTRKDSELELESSIHESLQCGGWTGSLNCVWYKYWSDIWPFWEREKWQSVYDEDE